MKRSKKQYFKKHFAIRSLERVGLILDDKEIVKQIQTQKLEFIKRQSNRVTIWRLVYQDKPYQVVYDKDRKQIITILFENLTAQNTR